MAVEGSIERREIGCAALAPSALVMAERPQRGARRGAYEPLQPLGQLAETGAHDQVHARCTVERADLEPARLTGLAQTRLRSGELHEDRPRAVHQETDVGSPPLDDQIRDAAIERIAISALHLGSIEGVPDVGVVKYCPRPRFFQGAPFFAEPKIALVAAHTESEHPGGT